MGWMDVPRCILAAVFHIRAKWISYLHMYSCMRYLSLCSKEKKKRLRNSVFTDTITDVRALSSR